MFTATLLAYFVTVSVSLGPTPPDLTGQMYDGCRVKHQVTRTLMTAPPKYVTELRLKCRVR